MSPPNLNLQIENYLAGRSQFINALLAINDWGTPSARKPSTCCCTTPNWPIGTSDGDYSGNARGPLLRRAILHVGAAGRIGPRPPVPLFTASRRERPAISRGPAARRGILQIGEPRRTPEPEPASTGRDPAAGPRSPAVAPSQPVAARFPDADQAVDDGPRSWDFAPDLPPKRRQGPPTCS